MVDKQMIPCGHVFHLDCIDMWVERHNSCPFCRKEVFPEYRYMVIRIVAFDDPEPPPAFGQAEDWEINIWDTSGQIIPGYETMFFSWMYFRGINWVYSSQYRELTEQIMRVFFSNADLSAESNIEIVYNFIKYQHLTEPFIVEFVSTRREAELVLEYQLHIGESTRRTLSLIINSETFI